MDIRLSDLEAQIAGGLAKGSGSSGGISISAVLDKLATLGATITDGIAYFTNIVTDTITIGTTDKPTGITIYDEVTGEPYCLSVANGDVKTRAGSCDDASSTSPDPSVDPTPDPVGQINLDPQTTTNPTDTSSSASDGVSADKEPPIIELRGNNPITLERNAQFLDPGVKVSDNETEDIHIRLEVTGDDINTAIVGTSTIMYSATDLAGNSTTAERMVEVINPNGLIIPAQAGIQNPGNDIDSGLESGIINFPPDDSSTTTPTTIINPTPDSSITSDISLDTNPLPVINTDNTIIATSTSEQGQ
jgi:hypothetical protein